MQPAEMRLRLTEAERRASLLAAGGESWRWQLRDRLGQWVEMGSKVMWLASGQKRTGSVVDSPRVDVATVEEDKSNRRIDIPASRLTVLDADEKAEDTPIAPEVPEADAPIIGNKAAKAETVLEPSASKDAAADVPTETRAAPKAKNKKDQSLFDAVWDRIKNFRNPDGSRREGRSDGTGSEDDPIFVDRDLDKAVQLLFEGKHIRLNDNREVAAIAKQIGPLIQQRRVEILRQYGLPEDTKPGNIPAEAADAKAALDGLAINLCQVHVPKTNLFCVEHKGIPRIHMPQLAGVSAKDGSKIDVQPQAEEMLSSMGLLSETQSVPVSELKASQSELGAEQIAGMLNAYKTGKMPDSVLRAPILVTKDGYIIDGHHRWATLMALDLEDGKAGDEKMQVKMVDMEIGEALATVNAFADAAGVAKKAASGKGSHMGDMPEVLRDAKVRKSVLDWIQQQLQPVAASAVMVGDHIVMDGQLREVTGMVAQTSAGRTFLYRSEVGMGLAILRDDEQVVRIEATL